MEGVGVEFSMLMEMRHFMRAPGWLADRGLKEKPIEAMMAMVEIGQVEAVVKMADPPSLIQWTGFRRLREGPCRKGLPEMMALEPRAKTPMEERAIGLEIGKRMPEEGRMAAL